MSWMSGGSARLRPGPPVDRVVGDVRCLAGQVEGAHAAMLRAFGSLSSVSTQAKDDEGRPRLLDDQLAELDRLGQDDLFLGGEQRDLADLLEVHPDRVVDPDEIGGERLQVLLALALGSVLAGAGPGPRPQGSADQRRRGSARRAPRRPLSSAAA